MSIAPTAHQHPHSSPALLKHAEERANNLQNRIADKITTFAGQNRADAKRQVIADHQWQLVQRRKSRTAN
jgi:hypothetical protein